MQARRLAHEHQRTQQQGRGRPIVASKLHDGSQLVAVKNRLLRSTEWKTFHDFLIDYLKEAFGTDWGNAELKKPFEQRHPVLVWYHKLCEQQRLFIKESGKVATSAMTGAVAAYLHLAYDLYALDHNAELQTKLIARLHSPEHFAGARYEVQVAATLVRAGFTIEFEDEDDRTTSHCEFTATDTRTDKKFSVEAKRAESGRINRQLVRALNKAANHTRIIFIDLNTPDRHPDAMPPAFVRRAFDLLRRFETLDPLARRLPAAYVIFTNAPWEHHLDDSDARNVTLADGFHIAEFKLDCEFQSLRAAINARQAHIEMHTLLKSIYEHVDIPATFDGRNPELAFSGEDHRLLIGTKYRLPDAEGKEANGILTSAVVMEGEGVAMCALHADDGRSIIVRATLSEAELRAWKRHSETFFGEIARTRKSETALDLYDFLMETYTDTPKAKLLEFMSGAPDIRELATLVRDELASVYCERSAVQAFAKGGRQYEPLLQTKWRPSTTKPQRTNLE